ncbi:N-acetylneuraminate synthase [Pseudobacter ginsenosidimutans]|uniref:N-acetylneuraminate synthase n=1 Tax=Pseudobacter ginsenosidimutans TaxID=661488 RepID=A0A4Q7MYI0_9BACT|nr:N-acetylneuraminate synthase [Pseudobacter ginsenosidimutans]RZS72200.1 N-acetylneuraminate synthase [Pseudobacter ginsenosidimutans]
MSRTYIIAEIGVNHNGNLDLALQSIQEAKKAGADCVKFQTFKAEQIVTQNSPKASYQLAVTDPGESQFSMLKKLELSFDDYRELLKACKAENVDFLSTPYNKADVDFLEKLDVTMYKIASGQLTELPFLRYVARTGKKIYLSTGMGTLSDVFDAVQAIREEGNNNLCVLQCTTNYPSKMEDANIKAMLSIREACKADVGYSDHVPENYACYAAVALGAGVIEKHFTLDKKMDGPDHSSSLDPLEFADLVKGIRAVEMSLGDGIKKPTEAERKNMYGMKRSLVVLKDMNAGEVLEEQYIGFKRPANGLSPNYLDSVIGKKLCKALKKDEPLQTDTINW